jgi:hypothetical protein
LGGDRPLWRKLDPGQQHILSFAHTLEQAAKEAREDSSLPVAREDEVG